MRRSLLCGWLAGCGLLAVMGCAPQHTRPYPPNRNDLARRPRAGSAPAAEDARRPGPADDPVRSDGDDAPAIAQASAELPSLLPDPPAEPDPAPIAPPAAERRASGFDPDLPQRPRTPRGPGPKLARAMDHAPDFSWIQGELEYSHLGGGIWKVRYAPISSDDEYGGSVILASEPQGVESGDMVYVEGRMTEQQRPGAMRNPIYRAERITRVRE
jgi:hypothetical protein